MLCYAMLCYAKSLQLCPTLCDPIDGSPPGSPIPEILQARTLEWVAISFSNAWKWKVKVKLFSRAQLLATPWTAAYQAPLSMGFSRQEYWSGVPLPSPKGTINKTKRQASEWQKIFVNKATDKGLISKIYKQQLSLYIDIDIKWMADLTRHFSKEYVQMANTYNSHSYVFQRI